MLKILNCFAHCLTLYSKCSFTDDLIYRNLCIKMIGCHQCLAHGVALTSRIKLGSLLAENEVKFDYVSLSLGQTFFHWNLSSS